MKKIYVSPEVDVIEVKQEELLVSSPGFMDGEVNAGDAAERLDAEGVMDIQDALEDINKSVGLSVWE